MASGGGLAGQRMSITSCSPATGFCSWWGTPDFRLVAMGWRQHVGRLSFSRARPKVVEDDLIAQPARAELLCELLWLRVIQHGHESRVFTHLPTRVARQ
jgi:hypothetical protein